MGWRRTALFRWSQEAGDVVVHCFGRAHAFSLIDGIQLSSGLYTELADPVSSLAQHRILISNDFLPAFQQSHDGARSERRSAERPRRYHQMDSVNDRRRSGVHGLAFEGMEHSVS